jgi:hypothetical protein
VGRCSAYMAPDFVAILDYACERGVARDVYTTNSQRIHATVDNALRCREAAPDFPWLPVVQGSTVEEYSTCLALYARSGWTFTYAGLGTMCGRGPKEARSILKRLAIDYPALRWHVFGMHLGILEDPLAMRSVQSWDSYSWNWGNGTKRDACRLPRHADESWSHYVQRLSIAYQARITTLLQRPQTLPLF